MREEFNHLFISPHFDLGIRLGSYFELYGRCKLPLGWKAKNAEIVNDNVKLYSFQIGTKIMFSKNDNSSSNHVISVDSISNESQDFYNEELNIDLKERTFSVTIDAGAISNLTRIKNDSKNHLLRLQNLGLNLQSLLSFEMMLNYKSRKNTGFGLGFRYAEHFNGYGFYLNENFDKSGFTGTIESSFVQSLALVVSLFRKKSFFRERFKLKSSIGPSIEFYPGERKGVFSFGSGSLLVNGIKFVSYQDVTNFMKLSNLKIDGRLEAGLKVLDKVSIVASLSYSQGLIRIAQTEIDYQYPTKNINDSAINLSNNSFYRLGLGLNVLL